MESAAVLRSFQYVGTSSLLKTVHENSAAVSNLSKFPVCGGKIISSTSRRGSTPVACDPSGALQSDSQNGSLEKKSSHSAAFPLGFEDLLTEVCDETNIAELKIKGVWNSGRATNFYFGEIYQRYRASSKAKKDIHTKLMRANYKDIPSWWFYILLAVTLSLALVLCVVLKKEIQMPIWALFLAALLAFGFTLPISIITATTNQTPGLNIITEYIMGLMYPGRPIANVCFKVYGYMSMTQAIAFLNDFKLGHYMKIPPRSMFLVQFLGTMIAGTVNMSVAWWLLHSIKDICHPDKFSNSPWTCPNDRVFFDASVIWGLVGPMKIFGKEGNYSALNWFFLAGFVGPVIVYAFHKAFPKYTWIPLINLPVLLGATANMPPAAALNYNSWILVGTIFNFFVFRYRKKWWQRYNYILSAALDAGVAFMAVLLYFVVGLENRKVSWWGTNDLEHCDLASCPTAKGIVVDSCPVF